ncbi:RNA polymerase sigma factor [Salisediminibacterium beveridgei]|uniref:RNA polymerase sigma factor sigX n=1 Tax=Salisediminibacterium beveridgei TaxID=632773 RepID=A0A1D7QWG7_9BACI|nr:RNA polymerase sigma factor [Salisediminibacterium beveridgei]AOM83351.1 RNA polymerase sigma factor sigX [Salisediminibacterium beveridgei]
MQDHELIEAAISGDEFALRRLHDLYVTQVFSYVYGQVASYHDAEEVLQDIFYKVAMKMNTFSGKSTFKTWVFSIARNTVLDYHRQAKKRNRSIATEEEKLRTLSPLTTSSEDEVILQDEIREALILMNELPETYRTVLHLRVIEEFTVEETAAIMKKSNFSVKALQRRARKMLQEHMHQEVMDA